MKFLDEAAASIAAFDGRQWRKFGDGAVIAPLGKWSLEATVLGWYPGHARHRRIV